MANLTSASSMLLGSSIPIAIQLELSKVSSKMAELNIPSIDTVPIAVQVVATVATILLSALIYFNLSTEKPAAGIPIIALDGMSAKQSWVRDGIAVLKKGYKLFPGKAFTIVTGTGPKIILPNRYANEIRNMPELSFNGAFKPEFFIKYPGFEGPAVSFNPHTDDLIQGTVRMKLTQSLGLITDDLVEESTDAIHDVFGEGAEWRTVVLKNEILQLVARLSSRVFLGRDLARTQAWLDIAKNYTVDIFIASRAMRNMHPLLRPILYWFNPHCTALRNEYKDAKALITSDFQRRQAEARALIAQGQKVPKTADAVGWMVELAKGREFDLVGGQLSLSMAAIHTTTEAMTYALVDLASHPEIVQPLREEVIRVLSEHGWSKVTLYQLRLMDSFLKESQRMKSPAIALGRRAEKDIVLSDGTKIPKHTRIQVETAHFDPEIYEDPEKFDAFRFAKLREQPGQGQNWQFVSVDARFMGFGLGMHACPGRFFVTNEIKIAMCHLLLKYDFQWVPNAPSNPVSVQYEAGKMFNPMTKLQVRRRREEIDLSSL